MITEESIRHSLPPLKHTRKTTGSPEVVKIKKIHEIRENDWKRLQKNIRSRYYTMKQNEDNTFMRDMWAFKDSSRSCVDTIQDTSGFRNRKEIAYKNYYKKRLETLFKSCNANGSLDLSKDNINRSIKQ